MQHRVIGLLKNETVLVVAAVIALVSCILIPPDRQYLGYIHVNTLTQLGSLMMVVCGFQRIGVFHAIGASLLSRVRSVRGLALVLVSLPFFSSMFITNDVALVTFVPFAIAVVIMAGLENHALLIVTLMTLGANVGSMLTPIGNAHNLYLKARSEMPTGEFLLLMAPYALVAALMLFLCCWFAFRNQHLSKFEGMDPQEIRRSVLAPRNAGIQPQVKEMQQSSGWRIVIYLLLFLVCLLGVAKLIPQWAMVLIVAMTLLICDRRVFLHVDWGLLLTFVAFFVFIGNARRIPQFYNLVSGLVNIHPLITSVLCSQVISNVPTALLVSGFSTAWRPIILGTNLGGLGTLVASMASLISYKAVVKQYPDKKGNYLKVYTSFNLLFLVVLVGMALLLE